MSRIPRVALVVLLSALALRCCLAVFDEMHPFFPPHNYVDSQQIHQGALRMLRAWTDGSPYPPISPGRELSTTLTASVYRLFGPHPLLPRLLNCAIATVALWAWYEMSTLLCGSTADLVTLVLLAYWPSNIFFSSQLSKDALFMLCLVVSLLPALRTWNNPPTHAGGGFHALFAIGVIAMVLLGISRPHVVPLVSASLLAGGTAAAIVHRGDRSRVKVCAIGCAWVLAAAAAFMPLSKLSKRLLGTSTAMPEIGSSSKTSPRHPPAGPLFSPAELSEYRRSRMESEQRHSVQVMDRRVETIIFPEAQFKSWWDIVWFLPKTVLYVLYMPLPGFYPLEGKTSRILAAAENVILLLLSAVALSGALRGPKGPAMLSLFAFFFLMVPCLALLEFDLGSASRHKLVYFPAIFPFAAWQIADSFRRLRSR